MDNDLDREAIELAKQGRWHEACQVNLKILSLEPSNIGALNRLAHAYSELGEFSQARKTAKSVLDIEPTNPIASKNLEKWLLAKNSKSDSGKVLSVETFLEEPGKTRLVTLVNLGPESVIAGIDCGDEVKLAAHSHRVSVIKPDGEYIGRLPDDIASRMKFLLKAGNKFNTMIKSTSKKNVMVFIREIENKTKSPSFPLEKIDYVSFTPPELIHKSVPENIEEEVILE